MISPLSQVFLCPAACLRPLCPLHRPISSCCLDACPTRLATESPLHPLHLSPSPCTPRLSPPAGGCKPRTQQTLCTLLPLGLPFTFHWSASWACPRHVHSGEPPLTSALPLSQLVTHLIRHPTQYSSTHRWPSELRALAQPRLAFCWRWLQLARLSAAWWRTLCHRRPLQRLGRLSPRQ